MPIPTPSAFDSGSSLARLSDDQTRFSSPSEESDAPPVPFSTALAAAGATRDVGAARSNASSPATQRSSTLSAFEQGLRKSKVATAACEEELQQSIDHSQASIEASKQLSGAQPQTSPVDASSPAGEEDQLQSQGDRKTKPARVDSNASPRADGSSAPAGTPPTAAAIGQVHEGGTRTPGQGGAEAPAARTLRGAAGTTQAVGATGAGAITAQAHAAEQAGAVSQGTAVGGVKGIAPGGASSAGTGAQGAGLAARGAPSAQARAKPFASLMQAARPQAPEATMVIRTSKALAQALRTGGDLKLDLSPEQLGRIQVRMTGTEEGMNIVLACHEPRAVEALERTLPQLRKSLEEQGVHAASMQVTLAEEASRSVSVESAMPGRHDAGSQTPPQGDSGAQGRQDSAHDRLSRGMPVRSDDEGELWEVGAQLGTVIANVPVAGMSRAVDVTI